MDTKKKSKGSSKNKAYFEFTLGDFWKINPRKITSEELLEQKSLEIEVITKFIQKVNSRLDLKKTFDSTLEGINMAIQPDLCFIFTSFFL